MSLLRLRHTSTALGSHTHKKNQSLADAAAKLPLSRENKLINALFCVSAPSVVRLAGLDNNKRTAATLPFRRRRCLEIMAKCAGSFLAFSLQDNHNYGIFESDDSQLGNQVNSNSGLHAAAYLPEELFLVVK